MKPNETQQQYLRVGMYSSFVLSVLTLVTFGLAMTAIPPAGPYCTGNCMDYPFPDLLRYYPRDYYWMYLAILQLFAFVIFIAANHFITDISKKLYSFLSIAFTLISSTVLLLTYFTQFSIVPISAMKGETEGIALITQYNDHGLFIAMEELGYITMSIALFFLAYTFTRKTLTERIIRKLLTLQLPLTVIVFIYYGISYGIERSYRFEVATISINWLILIITGLKFRKSSFNI